MLFFFSSRRRHTRSLRDWSSDVCSSDLPGGAGGVAMRIVIAEDSVLLREGLTRLLAEAGHQVVAGVGDADGLLAAVEEASPDLAVIDVRLPPGQSDEGIRAALALHRSHPSLALLILSQY